MIYSQLTLATVEITSHHLIKQYEDDKNGYVAWNALCEWYDDSSVKNETEYYLRSKLEIYRLTLASNPEEYINNFLTSFRELIFFFPWRSHLGELCLIFISDVKDPDFEMRV